MATALKDLDTKDVDQKASSILEAAKGLKITNDENYESAAKDLKVLKGLQKEIDETFDPVIHAGHTAHRTAIAAKKKHSEPLKQAEGIVKRKLGTYTAMKEQEAAEERRRLEAEAKKQADEEKLQEAAAAEEAGAGEEEVESILDKPAVVAPVQMAPPTPKVAGISTRTVWKYRIVDEAKIPREYLIPDATKIGQIVRAMKAATSIQGIEAYPEKVVAAGR